MTTTTHEEHIHKVKVAHDTDREYWVWCRENLATGEWHMKFAITGSSCSYYFKNPEDAVAFKLTFEL